MRYESIGKAKDELTDDDVSLTVEETHHCGSRLELSEDTEDRGGYVLTCPRCLSRVRKV